MGRQLQCEMLNTGASMEASLCAGDGFLSAQGIPYPRASPLLDAESHPRCPQHPPGCGPGPARDP